MTFHGLTPSRKLLHAGDPAATVAREHRSILTELIGLADYFEQWERIASDSERGRVEGVHQRLLHLLVLHGVRPTARAGGQLDPRYHEVVDARADPAAPPDTILEVVKAGYEMVLSGVEPATLRQAKVVVAVPPAPEPRDESQEAQRRGEGDE